MDLKGYAATIGIECHVQFNTKTKLFSAVGNDARGAAPNTLVSHIDFGLPGALPVLNEKAIELATRVAFAFNTKPQKFSKFDRKHYFYPDLPKGYQITQYDQPVIADGTVAITVNGQPKTINLTRAHLEEDAGKSTHPAAGGYSLVDLNRAGTPLLEIVSEPEIASAAEAKAYVRELWLLMRYAGVSDADLFHGNMRFDVNVSVSKDPSKLGTRTETKNLNSFRNVEKAVEYEMKRQIELLEKGQEIVQETRGWDDAKQKTVSQRSKEEAHDYRYFPDPDLPPVVIDDEYIDRIHKAMPVMPGEWRQRLSTLGVDAATVEILIDAQATTPAAGYLPYLETHLGDKEFVKNLVNWIVNVIEPLRAAGKVLPEADWRAWIEPVYALAKAGKLSSTNTKSLITDLLASGAQPKEMEKYATEQGYIQESDEGEIAKIVQKVLTDNPKAAEDIKNGEMKAIGFLVGQVMKASQGKANPGLAQQLIKKQLNV
jgi:aspartyl-tRNA(Asn)/glutamyl-tRNA(Gln) amidotransferase subunit B